jgi:tight adherence protein B
MTPMLYVLIFLATVLAVEGLSTLTQARRGSSQARARARLQRLAAGLQAPDAIEESILRKRDERTFTERLLAFLPRSRTLELRLYRAGVAMNTRSFAILSGALAVGGWVVGWVFFGDPAKALMLLGVGTLPYFQINRMARKRMGRFEKQFPDALELLTRAMRAGHSLTAGLQMVGNEIADPVGTEFSHVAEEVKLGQDVRQALAGVAYRIDTPDLPFFITAITIQRETGGNLAEVLEKLGHIIRERFKIYGKVRALTAIGRASSNLLAVWPVVMVAGLYAVNPGYVAPLWEQEQGHLMVFASVALTAVGFVIARRMAIIKV